MISDSTEAIHPGLDAILRARFDDPATVAVYADWLEEREDPRGTLIRMQSQPTVEGEPDCEAFIGRHWERWLGDVLPAPTSDRSSTLTWRSGFDGIQVCGACAGTAVRCHYRRVRTPRNDCIGEIDVEMQCDECGQFSRYKRLWHAGFPAVDDRNEWYWDDMEDELAAFREEDRLKEASGAAEEVHVNQPVEDEDAPF